MFRAFKIILKALSFIGPGAGKIGPPA
jgi:hypothetical protein